MENVYAYLKWRGDLSLSASAFNEVDSLILSLISYVDFDGIVPGIESEESITLQEASARYWRLHDKTDNTHAKSFLAKPPILLEEAASTKRFGEIRISKHVNRIDTQKEKQFSASTFQLSDNSIYLAYRGTDGTIVGWKEDFNMSFTKEIPAQLEAAEYLEKTFSWKYRNIRLGGHSKGGNLAIYSSIKCNRQIRDRILTVHNFDGPGFVQEIITGDEYMEMLPKITNYLPQSSIIGILLEHAGERKIIKSSQFGGLLQHDAFTWEVGALCFPYLNQLDKSSLLLDSIIKEWINKLHMEQRESFIDALFGVLANTGIERTSDFSKISNERIRSFVKSLSSLPVETKEIFIKTMKLFFAESRNAVKRELKDSFRILGPEGRNDGARPE